MLGYERFREQEERSTFATVLEIVRSVLAAGDWELDEEMLQTFARIFFGAMSSAGESVSGAEDPEPAAAASRPRSASSSPASRPWPTTGVELTPGAIAEATPERYFCEGDVRRRCRHQLDPGVPGRDGERRRPWSTA